MSARKRNHNLSNKRKTRKSFKLVIMHKAKNSINHMGMKDFNQEDSIEKLKNKKIKIENPEVGT